MGAILMFVKGVAGALLNPFVWVLLALAAAGAALPAYWHGRSAVQKDWDLDRALIAEAALQDLALRQANVVVVLEKYVDRVKIVKEKADAVVDQVPTLVASGERVSSGFVCVHNRAVAGDPGAACQPDGGAAATEAAETVAVNYRQYHLLAEQVRGLQDYVENVCRGSSNP